MVIITAVQDVFGIGACKMRHAWSNVLYRQCTGSTSQRHRFVAMLSCTDTQKLQKTRRDMDDPVLFPFFSF